MFLFYYITKPWIPSKGFEQKQTNMPAFEKYLEQATAKKFALPFDLQKKFQALYSSAIIEMGKNQANIKSLVLSANEIIAFAQENGMCAELSETKNSVALIIRSPAKDGKAEGYFSAKLENGDNFHDKPFRAEVKINGSSFVPQMENQLLWLADEIHKFSNQGAKSE